MRPRWILELPYVTSGCAVFCCLLLLGCASIDDGSAPDGQSNETTRMGTHGMLLYGDSNLFLYHLALYRRPHDRQILIPGAITDPRIANEYYDWRASYSGLVTIVPEQFDLDRLAPISANPITRIVADIYEGHFERQGQLRFESVALTLQKPVIHRAVRVDAPDVENFTYVSTRDTAYLIKDVGPRPGSDRILTLPLQRELRTGDRTTVIVLPEDMLALVRTGGQRIVIPADDVEELYSESQDFR